MTQTNADMVRGFIEAINQNQFDRAYEFCSPECISHTAPYVGLGLTVDDSTGEHVVVSDVTPGGPAAALQRNDELRQVAEAGHTWSTFQELKSSLRGQGIPGTPLTLTMKRGDQVLEFHLRRGEVNAFDQLLSSYLESWHQYKLTYWPDLKTEIQLLLETDEFVAWYAINRGANQEFRRAAIWGVQHLSPARRQDRGGLGHGRSFRSDEAAWLRYPRASARARRLASRHRKGCKAEGLFAMEFGRVLRRIT